MFTMARAQNKSFIVVASADVVVITVDVVVVTVVGVAVVVGVAGVVGAAVVDGVAVVVVVAGVVGAAVVLSSTVVVQFSSSSPSSQSGSPLQKFALGIQVSLLHLKSSFEQAVLSVVEVEVVDVGVVVGVVVVVGRIVDVQFSSS